MSENYVKHSQDEIDEVRDDSAKKLEEDVIGRATLSYYGDGTIRLDSSYMDRASLADVFDWLDRRAAITERENDELRKLNHLLRKSEAAKIERIDELEEECDEYYRGYEKLMGRCADLVKPVRELQSGVVAGEMTSCSGCANDCEEARTGAREVGMTNYEKYFSTPEKAAEMQIHSNMDGFEIFRIDIDTMDFPELVASIPCVADDPAALYEWMKEEAE